MNLQAPEARWALVDQALALVRERAPARHREQIALFVQQFYRQVDPEDLAGRPPQDLYGAAVSLWNFLRAGPAAPGRVRVYNPREEEHGWQSPHTIIEIVQRDMPFLVDSVRMEVQRQGFTLHLIIHPVVQVRREGGGDAARTGIEILSPSEPDPDAGFESMMHLEVGRESDPEAIARLQQGILRVLGDARSAVDDWQPMLARMREEIEAVERKPPPLPADEIEEGVAFLRWLTANHFTYLGCRDYELVERDGETMLDIVPGSGLGILRERSGEETSSSFASLPPEIRERARKPELLVVTKSNTRATVHRPGYMDYVGIKRLDASGKVVGERRFLGLYTSMAYSRSATEIPLLARKVHAVMERSGTIPGGHLSKALLAILDHYPRDELFQIGEDELLRIALGILHLQDRQRTRLFLRRDPFNRFFSCLVFVPRDAYDSEIRQRMQAVLMKALGGSSTEFSVNLSESVLARVLIIVHTEPGAVREHGEHDERALEAELVRVARRWEDDLADALVERLGEERGAALLRRYGEAFPAGYREDTLARTAVHDVETIEALDAHEGLGLSLYRPLEAAEGELRFRLYRRGSAVPLSQSLPMLERMGVRVMDERPYQLEPAGEEPVWIHDMGLRTAAGVEVSVDAVRDAFQQAFRRVWRGEAESDDFNRLVLAAGLDWREIVVLRAYAKYARQAGFTFSQAYMESALAAHPRIAAALVALFRERFDPDLELEPQARGADRVRAIEEALERVASLDEDRILRRLLALIQATLRTNFFQRDEAGQPRPFVSFKLDPARIPALPEPRPMFEIYVYSPRVEGVHLRGGRIARGGLRWSDRMEDFRTEVLGLMKAQMVKNAVIVPVGAKGGFVVKCPPQGGDREALMHEVIECYRAFLRGLLDLTDNRVGDGVVPPARLVRHDPDDPYLVVAADKGTATFSDIANAVAAEYGFWLGDAFASGGSSGYDHKKMGITARGAWESVRKHFRTLGVDVQASSFTVVGVGDMSGDVFGNGMLLSRHVRLVAAFDHRHVFIDPTPDAEASWRERKRLFELPRSSWADYDPALISEGGGVFARSAKSIPLSDQARQALGIEARALTPAELIRAVLRAPVDLLYNGGIGTYAKASDETHAEVGDRSNDAVRIDATELRCRVVGEGGNLGFTQRARIEYARAGGLINTDAIDNSGGVDCSDHEVNIKILLNRLVAEGELTLRHRDRLLEQMTEDVAALVLRDNYYQAQCLAVGRAHADVLLEQQARFVRFLERKGRLERAIEFLPPDDELAARRAAGGGLTVPEQAVLLAYGKIWLFDELLESGVPEDAWIGTALERYFPRALRERYREAIGQHPLAREIVATHVCNSMLNRVGSTFVHRMMEETGAAAADVVRAYLLVRETFGLVAAWQAIDALDNRVEDAVQTRMRWRLGQLIVRGSLWFLRRRLASADMQATIESFSAPVDTVADRLEQWLGEGDGQGLRADSAELVSAGVPAPLARQVARAHLLHAALDITELARTTGRDLETVGAVYFALADKLELAWLRDRITALPADTHWQTLARAALRDEMLQMQRSLTAEVLSTDASLADAQALVARWQEANTGSLARARQLIAELQGAKVPDLAMLSVGLRELRNLAA